MRISIRKMQIDGKKGRERERGRKNKYIDRVVKKWQWAHALARGRASKDGQPMNISKAKKDSSAWPEQLMRAKDVWRMGLPVFSHLTKGGLLAQSISKVS